MEKIRPARKYLVYSLGICQSLKYRRKSDLFHKFLPSFFRRFEPGHALSLSILGTSAGPNSYLYDMDLHLALWHSSCISECLSIVALRSPLPHKVGKILQEFHGPYHKQRHRQGFHRHKYLL
jgi:hypothetical protein